MIVSNALARIQNSFGRDLDSLVVQISLATLPLRLMIIADVYYTICNSVIIEV